MAIKRKDIAMCNELLTIGPVTIYGYGLMIGIGILVALFTATYRAKKHGLKSDYIYNIVFWVLIFGFLCAKLLYCIVEFDSFIKDPLSLLSGSGFVVYGGIIGGVAAAIVYCKIKKISFLDYFDLCMPSVAIAQGFGRIGCFLAGCCYGAPTDSFIGIMFTSSDIAPNGIKLIPTQLIMSVGNFLIAAILILYHRKKPAAGKVGWLYVILYSVGRFLIEFLRNDIRGSVGIFSTSQFISLFMFVIGVVLFIYGDKLFKSAKPVIEVTNEQVLIEQDETEAVETEETAEDAPVQSDITADTEVSEDTDE